MPNLVERTKVDERKVTSTPALTRKNRTAEREKIIPNVYSESELSNGVN
jgi:hypothetical protein